MLSAGEFCNRDVVIGHADESVVEFARRMRDYHVGTVVVVEERDIGRVPVGIVTDRDIVISGLARDPANVEHTLASELMSADLVVVRERDSLYDVLTYMRSRGIRRIPVVDERDVLQGIIAFDDLVAHIAEELGRLSGLLSREQRYEREHRPAEGTFARSFDPLGIFP